MRKVFCFGELLLRLSPEAGGGWIKNASMPVYIGGSELNVATALAKWNVPVAYCTSLPDNFLSQEIITELTHRSIDVSPILISGNRIGCFYLPQGADLKHASVIYDRAHSSFFELRPGQLNWDELLKDVSWFHFSAITPALNENLVLVCQEALEVATKKGLTISVDLNYRARLWQYGKGCSEVMPALVNYCDLVMGNIWAAEKMLQIPIEKNLTDTKAAYLEQSERTSIEVIKKFPRCRQVANTFRFDEKKGLSYYATLYEQGHMYVSNEYHTTQVVDRAGSGDCFMAGLIYGHSHQSAHQDILEFAVAAAFNKLFTRGDTINSSVEEIRKEYLNYV